MTEKRLNIVAFDVPWPPDYGGICDLYFKLKYLHSAGVKITYHCFFYEGHNPPTNQLEQFCERIFYYKRHKSLFRLLFSPLPYIVTSRQDPELLKNLLSNEDPILFDGIQTCFYLNSKQIRQRKRFVRANNVEHLYYRGLANAERSILKKLYLRREAKKLEKFEEEIKGVGGIFCVTKMDMKHFEKLAPTHYIPPFFNDDKSSEISIEANESGRFVLFHGNLSVNENISAANFILDNIAPGSKHKFVIAGHSAGNDLVRKIQKLTNVMIHNSPPQSKMGDLIRDAHVHLLLTDQQTGIKLKLLHALRSGKHVLINSLMDDSEIFTTMCRVADKPEEIKNKLDQLMTQPFSQEMREKRFSVFTTHFNNPRNAQVIASLI